MNPQPLSASSLLSIARYTNLDNLPGLIYSNLFEYLNVTDLMNLKLVVKRLYKMVNDYYDPVDLSIENGDYVKKYKDNWFSTVRPIELRHRLCLPRIERIRNPPDMFLNLRHLRIRAKDYFGRPIQLEGLNLFTRLRILEIHGICVIVNNVHLHLPELVALSIRVQINGAFDAPNSFIIDTPNLHSLFLSDAIADAIGEQAIIQYPLSIRHLKLDCVRYELWPFENVELLELCNTAKVHDDALMMLARLRTFKFNPHTFDDPVPLGLLFELNNINLEMFIWGIRITHVDKIFEIYAQNKVLTYQLHNYAMLEDDLNFVTEVQYEELIKCFRIQSIMPRNLFTKFTNIQKLITPDEELIVDENLLAFFISQCPNLTYLKVQQLLSQPFFNHLPAISSLTKLSFGGEDLNFEFLSKMTHLVKLDIVGDVLERINLNDLRSLKKFSFTLPTGIYDFEIVIKGPNKFTVYDPHLHYLNGLRINGLINLYEWIRKYRRENC